MGWLMLCCCTCLTVGRNLCGGSWRVSDFGVYLEWLFQLYNEMIVDGDATRRNLPLFVDAFFTTAPVRGCLLHNGTGAHFRRSRLDAARALPFTFTGTSSSGASSGPRRAFRSGEIRFPERNWHTPFLGTSTLRRESKGSRSMSFKIRRSKSDQTSEMTPSIRPPVRSLVVYVTRKDPGV